MILYPTETEIIHCGSEAIIRNGTDVRGLTLCSPKAAMQIRLRVERRTTVNGRIEATARRIRMLTGSQRRLAAQTTLPTIFTSSASLSYVAYSGFEDWFTIRGGYNLERAQ